MYAHESSYKIVGLLLPKTAFGVLDSWKSDEILVAWRSLPQAREGYTAHISCQENQSGGKELKWEFLEYHTAPRPLQQDLHLQKSLHLWNTLGATHTFRRIPCKVLLLISIVSTSFLWENIYWVRQWILGCWQGMYLFKGFFTSVFTGKPY